MLVETDDTEEDHVRQGRFDDRVDPERQMMNDELVTHLVRDLIPTLPADALAAAIDPAPATGLRFGGSGREAVAFNIGGAVTDLVVLANAERVPAIERSLARTDARLRALAESLDEAEVTAAEALGAGALAASGDEATREALESDSEALRGALADGASGGTEATAETGLRFDLGGALGFVALAATLEPVGARMRGL